MTHRKVERLPLIDELGMLGGIVSRADLPKVFLHGDEEIAEELRREVVVYPFPTPGSAICVDVHNGG
jgi:predicted transcriptional regulator